LTPPAHCNGPTRPRRRAIKGGWGKGGETFYQLGLRGYARAEGEGLRDRFEIVDHGTDGSERVINSEFTSPKDAAMAAAFGIGPRGLPEGVVKREVRHVGSREWVCEWIRREGEAK